MLYACREEEYEEEALFPSAFGKRIKEGAERRVIRSERERKRLRLWSKGGLHGAGLAAETPEFDKHTQGIGRKLLEKMGYTGGGLGKNEQGMVVPIEVKLRPKNMGVGFNDYREAHAIVCDCPGPGELEARNKEAKPKEKLWHKNYQGTKRAFKTAHDWLALKNEQGIFMEATQTVLDMRGPQIRVLTSLEHLNAEETDINGDIPMPELQHNVRLIVDLVEADVQRFHKKLKQEKERAVLLEKERMRLQGEVKRQEKQIGTLEHVTRAIGDAQQKIASGGMNVDAVASAFSTLKRDHADEYKLHDLSAVALSFGLPPIVKLFHGWDPLLQPFHGIDIVSLWKCLLQGDDPTDYSSFPDTNSYGDLPYSQLVMEAVFPALRFAIVNIWAPRHPEPLLGFLGKWENLLPKPVLHNILVHLVMPKLSLAVQHWDPRQETVPIHAWLHPWLPFLGQHMEPLHRPICYKLESTLRAWHASDSSAYALLSPWQTVFDPGSWELLLVRSILPKLLSALHELMINPQSQQFEPLGWVSTWRTVVPMHHMVALLEAGFFTKWHQFLHTWLRSTPDFKEVAEWYRVWKHVLTSSFPESERVWWHLRSALDIMEQAVEGMPVLQSGAKEHVSYLHVKEEKQSNKRAAAQPYSSSACGNVAQENGSASAEMSLKEVVETFAKQNDVRFLPKVGRVHEGFQVYAFGSTKVCIDNAQQRLYVQSGDKWVAVSLGRLLEMHQAQV